MSKSRHSNGRHLRFRNRFAILHSGKGHDGSVKIPSPQNASTFHFLDVLQGPGRAVEPAVAKFEQFQVIAPEAVLIDLERIPMDMLMKAAVRVTARVPASAKKARG